MSKHYITIPPKTLPIRLTITGISIALLVIISLLSFPPLLNQWKHNASLKFLIDNNAFDDGFYNTVSVVSPAIQPMRVDPSKSAILRRYHKKLPHRIKILKNLAKLHPISIKMEGDWTEAFKAVPEFDTTKVTHLTISDTDYTSEMGKLFPNVTNLAFASPEYVESDFFKSKPTKIDLSTIQNPKNLVSLSIQLYQVESFDQISNFSNLEYLSIASPKNDLPKDVTFPKTLETLIIRSKSDFDFQSLSQSNTIRSLTVTANTFFNQSKNLSFPSATNLSLTQTDKHSNQGELPKFPGLTAIQITGFKIKAISNLGLSKTFNHIAFKDINIDDWSGLEKTKSIEFIEIQNCSVMNPKHLPQLSCNSVLLMTDFQPLLSLSKIQNKSRVTNLAFNQVSDFSEIKKMVSLNSLEIGNQIIDQKMAKSILHFYGDITIHNQQNISKQAQQVLHDAKARIIFR